MVRSLKDKIERFIYVAHSVSFSLVEITIASAFSPPTRLAVEEKKKRKKKKSLATLGTLDGSPGSIQ